MTPQEPPLAREALELAIESARLIVALGRNPFAAAVEVNSVAQALLTEHAELTALRARLAQADDEIERLTDERDKWRDTAYGYEGLKNDAESRAAQAEAENAVMVGALTAMCVACDPSICSGAMLAAYHRAREALTHTTEGARQLLDVVNAALEMHHSDDAFHWAGRNIELRSAVQKLSAQSNKVEGQ